jgi:murein DD-endopeptidase MepM/ murein hydrolase activator NlpD
MSDGMARIGVGLVILMAAGCHMAPDYEVPKIETPPDFKVKGPWKVAAPADEAEKGEWWRMFGDAELNRLQAMLAAENPTLEAALKRVEMARAGVDEQRAAYFPEIGFGVAGLQNRTSSNSPGFRAGQTLTFWRAPITFQYELDLWGRVRGSVAASRAELASQEALAENTRLMLHAELATHYLQLRALDAERALLEEAVELRRRTLGMVETRFKLGDVAELDVAQAKTELAEAEGEAIAIQRRRAERENAVAALCGRVASSMKLGRRPLAGTPPGVRKVLPSSLLERRPDVASRERLMAAANERAGMTRTAYFPQERNEPEKKPASYLDLNAKDVALNSSFQANRALLPWPVDNGIVTLTFGRNKIDNLDFDNPGITIATPTYGIPVKTVFDGEVSGIYNLGDGMAVTIRHGKYFTTYSNLSSVAVSKGDAVRTGQQIGKAGRNDDGSTGQIDFILMIETKNVDPKPWLRR